MTIKELRKLSGLTQTEFGKKYGIPKVTIENWEAAPDKKNHRQCPEYVRTLLERAVKEDFAETSQG